MTDHLKEENKPGCFGAIGLPGKRHVRDLWRQKDLGESRGVLQAEVPRHGCVLLRVSGKP